ncbi:MAG: hypothetical protein KY476_16790 [Planctomycetes bacterium]|nr:hypothetical protein [Planctomycetota bacterium]
MNTHWVFSGCDGDDRRAVEDCWGKLREALLAKFESLAPAPIEFRIAVDRDSENDVWTVQAVLHQPSNTFAEEETDADVAAALRRVSERLAASADKRSRAHEEPGRRTRLDLEALVPLLKRNHASGRSRTFFTLLQPALRTLAHHAHRELEVLQLDEATVGELTVSEILDETLLRAWDRFNSWPDRLPLDLWLVSLMDEAVHDLAAHESHESLEDRRRIPAETPDWDDDSPDTWSDHPTFYETVELGELIPGHDGLDAWDRLDVETRQTGTAALLARLPRNQRQALVYFAVEGYEPAAIADVQDRRVEDVQADIDAARQSLRLALADEDFLQDVEEQFERAGTHEERERRRRR